MIVSRPFIFTSLSVLFSVYRNSQSHRDRLISWSLGLVESSVTLHFGYFSVYFLFRGYKYEIHFSFHNFAMSVVNVADTVFCLIWFGKTNELEKSFKNNLAFKIKSSVSFIAEKGNLAVNISPLKIFQSKVSQFLYWTF